MKEFYSQHGQDKWVLETLNYKRNGYFLDTGAYHPEVDSNTCALERNFDWTGIGVEPNPKLYKLLTQQRKCILYNCVIGQTPGIVDFLQPQDGSGFSGIVQFYGAFDRERICKTFNLQEPLEQYAKKLPCKTLRCVLSEALAPHEIDYWSLDVEGAELMLLQTFPWNDYMVQLLTVEHNNNPNRELVQAFLKTKGYKCLPNLLCPWEDHFVYEGTD